MINQEIITKWVKYVSEDLSANSIESYTRYISKVEKSFLELATEDINDFLDKLSTKSAKIQAIFSLNNLFKYLLDTNKITKNPMIGHDKYKNKDKKELKIPTDREFKKIKEVVCECKNIRDIAIFTILSNCGLRVSELINIDMDDIYTEESRTYINIKNTKNGKDRTISLNNLTKEKLNNYIKDRVNYEDLNEKLVPLTRQGINLIINRYSRLARVKITPHGFRHYFATKALEITGDVATVSNVLGHSSIKTTQIYLHIGKKAANKIAEAVVI